VPSYDFAVDLHAMVTAAQHIADSVQTFKDDDVADLVPTSAALGDDEVASAVGEFTSRWEEGMNNLMHDVEEMSGRLGKVAMNYAEFDSSGHETLTAAATAVRTTTGGGR
jgi:methyl-accepting chemotaxis protein